jgi:beta-lactamase class A
MSSFRIVFAAAFLFPCFTVQAQKTQSREQKLQAIVAAHHGDVALFAENLKTGQSVGIHPDQPVQTASVIKLTILYEAMEQIRAGRVHLDDPIVMHKEDQVQGSGVLLFFNTPLRLTFQDVLSMMIIMSDNTATNLVIDHLGLANINKRIALLGLKNTHLYRKVFMPAEGPLPPDAKQFGLGKTTPREMASIMQKIVTCHLAEPGTAPLPGDAALCSVAMHMLRNQFYREGIPRYLEAMYPDADSAIADKIGSLDDVRNDVAAINTKQGLLILSIFTYNNHDQMWSVDNEGEQTLAKLGKAIVDAWAPNGLVSFDSAPAVQ